MKPVYYKKNQKLDSTNKPSDAYCGIKNTIKHVGHFISANVATTLIKRASLKIIRIIR